MVKEAGRSPALRRIDWGFSITRNWPDAPAFTTLHAVYQAASGQQARWTPALLTRSGRCQDRVADQDEATAAVRPRVVAPVLGLVRTRCGLNRHCASARDGRGMTTATLKRPGPVTLPHCPCHPSVLTIKLPGRPPATRRPTPDRSHAALRMPHRQNRSPARQNHDYHRQNRAFRPHDRPHSPTQISGNERK